MLHSGSRGDLVKYSGHGHTGEECLVSGMCKYSLLGRRNGCEDTGDRADESIGEAGALGKKVSSAFQLCSMLGGSTS